MKIAFICMSQDLGRDGTADYTRRLADYCSKQGYWIRIFPLGRHDWLKRPHALIRASNELETALEEFRPDVISWQFDGHLFSPRCIYPAWIVPDLRRFKAVHHVMVHETWEGEFDGAKINKVIKGRLQRRSLKGFLRMISPRVLHTSIRFYQWQLSKLGFEAEILPLFPNISPNPGVEFERNYSSDVWKFIFFAGIPCGWKPHRLMEKLLRVDKKLIFYHVGALTDQHLWDDFAKEYQHIAEFVDLGIQPAERISQLLADSHFAISTYAPMLQLKSGVYAAFRVHGLPVIFSREDGAYKKFPLSSLEKSSMGISIDELPDRLFRSTRSFPGDTLALTGEQFLRALKL